MTDLKRLLLKLKFVRLDLGIPGAVLWLKEANDGYQIVFTEFTQDFSSDQPHTNDCSQWGIVLDGEVVLYTDHRQALKRGDTFFVEKGIPHRVEIRAGYKDLTIFSNTRYPDRSKERR